MIKNWFSVAVDILQTFLWSKKYFLPVIAGFIIATPLPDKMGVALLATLKIISSRVFFMISFLLNTIGIFIII